MQESSYLCVLWQHAPDNWQLVRGGAKASLLLRAQIISVLRLALLQMNLWAHPKKKQQQTVPHKTLTNSISMQSLGALVPQFPERDPEGRRDDDLTMCGHKASQGENNKLIKSFKLHERVKCNKG